MMAGLITNGYFLVPKRIQALNEAGLDFLQISIDNVEPDEVSKKSLRVLTAMTTSSSEVLPARSPRPLMVHSIWRAPPSCTAASEFATAMPRSLWQCTDHTALSELGTRSLIFLMSSPNCCGTA